MSVIVNNTKNVLSWNGQRVLPGESVDDGGLPVPQTGVWVSADAEAPTEPESATEAPVVETETDDLQKAAAALLAEEQPKAEG